MKTLEKSNAQSFKRIPKDYRSLCSRFLPRPIHDADDCDEANKAIIALVGFEEQLSLDQTDYLEAISTFIEQYEQKIVR